MAACADTISPAEQKQPYYAKRIELFEKYFERETGRVEEAKAKNDPIKIVLPDGSVKEGIKFATTPWDIAMGIHKKLAQGSVVARVDKEQMWDMRRPLEGDCTLEMLSFDDDLGKEVRASSACANPWLARRTTRAAAAAPLRGHHINLLLKSHQ